MDLTFNINLLSPNFVNRQEISNAISLTDSFAEFLTMYNNAPEEEKPYMLVVLIDKLTDDTIKQHGKLLSVVKPSVLLVTTGMSGGYGTDLYNILNMRNFDVSCENILNNESEPAWAKYIATKFKEEQVEKALQREALEAAAKQKNNSLNIE